MSKGISGAGGTVFDFGVFVGCSAYTTFTAMQRCTLFRTARRELTGIFVYGYCFCLQY